MFIWRRASPLGRARPLPRSRVLVKFFVKIYFHLYERRATPLWVSDSEFRGKINVVSPGDSDKWDSPSRRAGFSHVNARWNPTFLLGLALPRSDELDFIVNNIQWLILVQLIPQTVKNLLSVKTCNRRAIKSVIIFSDWFQHNRNSKQPIIF